MQCYYIIRWKFITLLPNASYYIMWRYRPKKVFVKDLLMYISVIWRDKWLKQKKTVLSVSLYLSSLHSKMITHTHTTAWTWCILIVMCDLCSSVVTACDYCLRALETAEENARRLSGKPGLSLPHPELCRVRPELHQACPQCQVGLINQLSYVLGHSSAQGKKKTSLSHLKRKRGIYIFYFKVVRSILFQTRKLLIAMICGQAGTTAVSVVDNMTSWSIVRGKY